MSNNKTRGVYFVANDLVIDLTIAFLNSFRKFNPTISLCLIPFKDDIEEISKLKEKFNFSIYSDAEFLDYCDNISLKFHHKIIGHYRKLAIWQGPFDEFVYIDIDTLVLKNIDFVFPLLSEYDFITSFSNLPSIRQWVWKDSIYKINALSEEQINYGANTGFIVSKKNNISKDDIEKSLAGAMELSYYMEFSCMEQPFLNYLIVTSNKAHTSLYKLLDSKIYPENYVEFWAGRHKKFLMKNMQTVQDEIVRDIFLIHWAGVWQKNDKDFRIFKLLKSFKIRKTIWSTSIFMPYRKLWKHYRYLNS
ncbi:MAG: hypothetical protein K9J13_07890 [Saprospiraceae bacterium]|nr:hypothetical protein [Saprospiraceae bacterium]